MQINCDITKADIKDFEKDIKDEEKAREKIGKSLGKVNFNPKEI